MYKFTNIPQNFLGILVVIGMSSSAETPHSNSQLSDVLQIKISIYLLIFTSISIIIIGFVLGGANTFISQIYLSLGIVATLLMFYISFTSKIYLTAINASPIEVSFDTIPIFIFSYLYMFTGSYTATVIIVWLLDVINIGLLIAMLTGSIDRVSTYINQKKSQFQNQPPPSNSNQRPGSVYLTFGGMRRLFRKLTH